MTDLAKKIQTQMANNKDAEQIMAMGIGSSVYEVEFIMEQLRQAK